MTDFIHHFEAGVNPNAVILALHGTGGNEHDLVPLVRDIAPDTTIVSPRGKVLENGMPRFFRRLAEGVFDHEDLVARTHELADFIRDFRKIKHLEDRKVIAVGYSNGANIASALLLLRPDILDGAVLMRGMPPFQPILYPDLSDKSVLILAGKQDPIVGTANTQALHDIFTETHAFVTTHELPAGHHLTQDDITLARDWINAL
jgi:phospholipase/carboxylesterase